MNAVLKNASGRLGAGVKFERIRRITGYLVGSLERFNDAKRAEERARVKHGLAGACQGADSATGGGL